MADPPKFKMTRKRDYGLATIRGQLADVPIVANPSLPPGTVRMVDQMARGPDNDLVDAASYAMHAITSYKHAITSYNQVTVDEPGRQRSEMEELMYAVRLIAEEVGLPYVRIHEPLRMDTEDSYEIVFRMPDERSAIVRITERARRAENHGTLTELLRHEINMANQEWRMSVDYNANRIQSQDYAMNFAEAQSLEYHGATTWFRFEKPEPRETVKALWEALPRQWREVALLEKLEQHGDAWELANDILVQMAEQHRQNMALQGKEAKTAASLGAAPAPTSPTMSLAQLRSSVRDAGGLTPEYMSDAQLDAMISRAVERLVLDEVKPHPDSLRRT